MTVIDGYNLLLSGGDPGAALWERREEFLRRVDAVRTAGERVIVVFDGAAGPERTGPGRAGLEVRYSRPGRSADDLIVSLVRNAPRRGVTVLTRDRELAHRVKRAGGTIGDPGAYFRGPRRREPPSTSPEKPRLPEGSELDEWERLFGGEESDPES